MAEVAMQLGFQLDASGEQGVLEEQGASEAQGASEQHGAREEKGVSVEQGSKRPDAAPAYLHSLAQSANLRHHANHHEDIIDDKKWRRIEKDVGNMKKGMKTEVKECFEALFEVALAQLSTKTKWRAKEKYKAEVCADQSGNFVAELEKTRDRLFQDHTRKHFEDVLEEKLLERFIASMQQCLKSGSDKVAQCDTVQKFTSEIVTKFGPSAQAHHKFGTIQDEQDIDAAIEVLFGNSKEVLVEFEDETVVEEKKGSEPFSIEKHSNLLPFIGESVSEILSKKIVAMGQIIEESMTEKFQKKLDKMQHEFLKKRAREDHDNEREDLEEEDITEQRKSWLRVNGPTAIDDFKDAFLSQTWEGLSENAYGYFIHNMMLSGSVFKGQAVPETSALIFSSLVGVVISAVIQFTLAYYLYSKIVIASDYYAAANDVCRTQSFVQIVCIALFLFNVLNNVPGLVKNFLIIWGSTRFISDDEDGVTKVHYWRQNDFLRDIVDIRKVFKSPTFLARKRRQQDQGTSLFVNAPICLGSCSGCKRGGHSTEDQTLDHFREITQQIARDSVEVWELRDFLTARLVALDPSFAAEASGKTLDSLKRKLVVMDYMRPSWLQPFAYRAWKEKQQLFETLPSFVRWFRQPPPAATEHDTGATSEKPVECDEHIPARFLSALNALQTSFEGVELVPKPDSTLEVLYAQADRTNMDLVKRFVDNARLYSRNSDGTLQGWLHKAFFNTMEAIELVVWRWLFVSRSGILEEFDQEYKLNISEFDESVGGEEQQILETLAREETAGPLDFANVLSEPSATNEIHKRHKKHEVTHIHRVLLENSKEIIKAAPARERLKTFPARMLRFRIIAFLFGVLPEIMTLTMIIVAGIQYIMWSGSKIYSSTSGMEEIILATLAICFIYDIDEQLFECVIPEYYKEAHKGDRFDVPGWLTPESSSLKRRRMFTLQFNAKIFWFEFFGRRWYPNLKEALEKADNLCSCLVGSHVRSWGRRRKNQASKGGRSKP